MWLRAWRTATWPSPPSRAMAKRERDGAEPVATGKKLKSDGAKVKRKRGGAEPAATGKKLKSDGAMVKREHDGAEAVAAGKKLKSKKAAAAAASVAAAETDGKKHGARAPQISDRARDGAEPGAKEGKKRSSKKAAAAAASEDATVTDQKRSGARIHCTVFVGQLPLRATAHDVAKHFEAAGSAKVRLLTHRKGGGSRGIAFVELESESAVHSALKLHHSVMDGRRINVERTVGGGGKSDRRAGRLSALRQKQGSNILNAAKALVASTLPEEGGERDAPTQRDADDRVIEFLSTIEASVAEAALKECVELDMSSVKNRPAYLMGVLKRKTEQSDRFKPPAETKGGRGGRSGGKGGGKGGCRGRGEGRGGRGSGAWSSKAKDQAQQGTAATAREGGGGGGWGWGSKR